MRAAQCPHCRGMRLVGVAEAPEDSPHAFRAASVALMEKWGRPWPSCAHGIPWSTDCRDVPVLPACCRHLSPAAEET